MARGLVRNNNFSDIENAEEARINLGLSSADYNRLRGLYSSANITHTDILAIAGSTGNYQAQINSLNGIFTSLRPSAKVNIFGDTIVSGWTNNGYIQTWALVSSGTTLGASSDSLFSLTVSGLSYALSTATLTMTSGVTVSKLSSSGNTIYSSGVVPDRLVPVKINGVQYYFEAG